MVRITIVGRECPPVNYSENSNTRTVKDDLKDAFGPGLLMRGGEGVTTETLSGNYEFHVIGMTGGGGSAGAFEVRNRYRHTHVLPANISDEEIAARLARDNTSCITVTVTIFRSQSCVRKEIVHSLCRMGFKYGFARRLNRTTVQIVVVLPSGRPEGILELARYFGDWAVSKELFVVDHECRDPALVALLQRPFCLIKSGIPDPENRSDENFDCYSSDDGGYEIRSDRD